MGTRRGFEMCPSWVPVMDGRRRTTQIILKTVDVDRFYHSASCPPKVRNVSRLGSHSLQLRTGKFILLTASISLETTTVCETFRMSRHFCVSQSIQTAPHAGLPLFGGLVQLDVDAVRVFDKDTPSIWRKPNDFAAGGHDWRLGSADRLQHAIKILDTER